MNILLIGSGGREHALAWKLSRSPRCEALYIAPGNPGTAQCGMNIALNVSDHEAVAQFCIQRKIDLVVVGPEAPLVAGLADDLGRHGLRVFGPTKEAAQLEGSKAFTKALCDEANVPTAAYARFTSAAPALAYVREKGAPIVIKADGLAAGKGVVVAMSLTEAEDAIRMMFSGGLGAAGEEVVIEECMIGEEASFFVLCDGDSAMPLASAQDHKRVGDGDTGPNTGGMGAYSPAPVMTQEMEQRVMRDIILPSVQTMKKRGTPFKGVLFAGLMITKDGPKLIEYNVRFGDPECEVLMPRLDTDLVDLLEAAVEERLAGQTIQWKDEAALTVIMAAENYPGTPKTGTVIKGVDKAAALPSTLVFHAGTRLDGETLLANGGRVLAVTGLGKTVAEAQKRAYDAVKAIDWPGGFCRKDIGHRAIGR